MAKVIYEDVTTKTFNKLLVGDYFIYNGKLYLKINSDCPLDDAFDFEDDRVVSFTDNATVIFKSDKDIEIKVNK